MRSDMFHLIRNNGHGKRNPTDGRSRFRAAKHFILDEENDVWDAYCGSTIHLKNRDPYLAWDESSFANFPLSRYLSAQVGRHWNAVYADISPHLRRSLCVKPYIHAVVNGFYVVTKTYRRADGRVINASCPYMSECDVIGQLYVEPDSGILRAGTHPGWNKTARRPDGPSDPW